MYYVLGILGLIAFVGGTVSLRRGLKSRKWPITQGAVKEAYVETEYSKDSPGTAFHTPRIRYSYKVGGVAYEGTTISAKSYGSANKEQIDGIVQRYQKSPQVTVHYNPDKPDTALLETGVNFISYLPLVIGLLMVTLAVLGLVGVIQFDT